MILQKISLLIDAHADADDRIQTPHVFKTEQQLSVMVCVVHVLPSILHSQHLYLHILLNPFASILQRPNVGRSLFSGGKDGARCTTCAHTCKE